jgi:hypothetical protein
MGIPSLPDGLKIKNTLGDCNVVSMHVTCHWFHSGFILLVFAFRHIMELQGVQDVLKHADASVLPDEVDFDIACELQGPGVSEEIWTPAPEVDARPE